MSTSTSEHVDQVSSDATKSSTDILEQTESSEKQPSLETVVSRIETKIIKDNHFFKLGCYYY